MCHLHVHLFLHGVYRFLVGFNRSSPGVVYRFFLPFSQFIHELSSAVPCVCIFSIAFNTFVHGVFDVSMFFPPMMFNMFPCVSKLLHGCLKIVHGGSFLMEFINLLMVFIDVCMVLG